ncbi:hypothetical protein HA44_09005 [Mixta gaviniae]|nr:hypothetical protein HA44_09005 [Mixta gaviniae]
MERLVSILIPVYNCEKFIEKTLLSIIEQSYKNIEIVIVDDCSTDNTLQRVYNLRDRYPQVRFVIQKNQPNLGVSATRNRLVDAASGDYIAFLDSDDYLESNMIEALVTTLESQQVDVSQCLYFYESEDGAMKKGYQPLCAIRHPDRQAGVNRHARGRYTGLSVEQTL